MSLFLQSRRALAAAPFVLAAAVAAPAQADAGVLTDKACYIASPVVQPVTVIGKGFAPGSVVTLSFAPTSGGLVGTANVTADDSGAFSEPITGLSLDKFTDGDRTDIAIVGYDQNNPELLGSGALTTLSAWKLALPGTNWGTGHGSAKRGKRYGLRAFGWANLGSTLFAHYYRGGKLVHTDRVGALHGDCGDLSTTFRAFAWGARPGTYAIRFSTSRSGSSSAKSIGAHGIHVT